MTRSMKVIALATGLAITLPAFAQVSYRSDDDIRYDYANVVRVDAVINHYREPITRDTCWRDSDDTDRARLINYRDPGADERCRTDTEWHTTDRVVGYDVTYRYDGREYQTRLSHDPGNRLRVRVNYDYSIAPDER